jgi:hypothetical protein
MRNNETWADVNLVSIIDTPNGPEPAKVAADAIVKPVPVTGFRAPLTGDHLPSC